MQISRSMAAISHLWNSHLKRLDLTLNVTLSSLRLCALSMDVIFKNLLKRVATDLSDFQFQIKSLWGTEVWAAVLCGSFAWNQTELWVAGTLVETRSVLGHTGIERPAYRDNCSSETDAFNGFQNPWIHLPHTWLWTKMWILQGLSWEIGENDVAWLFLRGGIFQQEAWTKSGRIKPSKHFRITGLQ